MQVETLGAVQRMGLHLDVEIKVAVAPAVDALAALAGHPQLLAVGHALRHPDADLARNAAQEAVRVGLGHRDV